MTRLINLTTHNPDVLNCIANLSNDEVFTPPNHANQMLDAIEQVWRDTNKSDIWKDPAIKFLDPCTKSGVFLREITKRLITGLSESIPDLNERVDHILTKQVYGIGLTSLTSLVSRRSLYCSRKANGEHSVAVGFETESGNIWFEKTEHVWEKERCIYCGVRTAEYKRSETLESHAYAFIHNPDPHELIKEMFGEKMHFDVIIGNPPYQLSTGGTGGAGVQAKPIYNLFINQAKKLNPRYLCMVTPSRWFSGGMGLDSFRKEMLEDTRIRQIHDFPDSNDVFVGTQIKGGVSYFLWDRDNSGDVEVTTHDKGDVISVATRPLLEPGADVFIRYNKGVSILRKVMQVEHNDPNPPMSLPEDKRFMDRVSVIGAFGLSTTFRGKSTKAAGDVLIYRNGGKGYLARKEITKSDEAIDWWKVFIPPAGSGSDSFPHPILGTPFVGAPGTASSWTYMHIGPFESQGEAENVCHYISSKFFRFLVLLHKPTQHATRSVYTFVPMQNFKNKLADKQLYEKYGISDDEIEFIESMIQPKEYQNEVID